MGPKWSQKCLNTRETCTVYWSEYNVWERKKKLHVELKCLLAGDPVQWNDNWWRHNHLFLNVWNFVLWHYQFQLQDQFCIRIYVKFVLPIWSDQLHRTCTYLRAVSYLATCPPIHRTGTGWGYFHPTCLGYPRRPSPVSIINMYLIHDYVGLCLEYIQKKKNVWSIIILHQHIRFNSNEFHDYCTCSQPPIVYTHAPRA